MLEEYVVVDIETTGLKPGVDKIIEIGAIKIKKNQEPKIFQAFVNPQIAIPKNIVELTGITNEMVEDAKTIESVILDFLAFAENLTLIGHNLKFDYSFLKTEAKAQKQAFERKGIDTLKIARKYLPDLKSKKLDDLCRYFGIEDNRHHRADNDAKVTNQLYEILCEKFELCAGELEKGFVPESLQFSIKKESPVTAKQVAYLQALLDRHGLSTEVCISALTKSEASKMIDNIILHYGR